MTGTDWTTEGTDSISGATARTLQPEAMMARGARVTGSGAAALASPWPGRDEAIARSSGAPMVFAVLENFDVEVFL